MQTFLPYADYEKSAKCLDYRRLGKQRIEAWQILEALNTGRSGWINHPAVLMWAGYNTALAAYGLAMCDEWILRGYRDTLRDRFKQERLKYRNYLLPHWFGNENLHASHRSNLLRKHPIWYSQFHWLESNDLPYVWPK